MRRLTLADDDLAALRHHVLNDPGFRGSSEEIASRVSSPSGAGKSMDSRRLTGIFPRRGPAGEGAHRHQVGIRYGMFSRRWVYAPRKANTAAMFTAPDGVFLLVREVITGIVFRFAFSVGILFSFWK